MSFGIQPFSSTPYFSFITFTQSLFSPSANCQIHLVRSATFTSCNLRKPRQPLSKEKQIFPQLTKLYLFFSYVVPQRKMQTIISIFFTILAGITKREHIYTSMLTRVDLMRTNLPRLERYSIFQNTSLLQNCSIEGIQTLFS